MGRSRDRPRCPELQAELARWKQDYRDLAMAVAKGQGFPTQAPSNLGRAVIPLDGATFSAEPTLPGSVFAAIEDTTEPFSDARTMALEAAKALLESGVKPEEVEAQLRQGEDIKV